MTCIKIEEATKIIRKNTVLDHVTLAMESGRVYGLHGVNGSGKTMLMRALLGLIRLTSGTIAVDGKILGKEIDFPESVGFLLENPSFLDRYSGYDNLMLLAKMRGKVGERQVRAALWTVGLGEAANKKYKRYSLGMKQRLGIAAAILEQPDIVLLDEPTNALDASGVQTVKQIVRQEKARGAIVMLSCHDAALLDKLADVHIEMEEGRIVSQTEIARDPFGDRACAFDRRADLFCEL